MKAFANLPTCETHGLYVGRSCPLCPQIDIMAARTVDAIPDPRAAADEFADNRGSWWKGPEKEWHDLFATWLQHHGVEFVHARTDVKSTIENGWPDFTCLFTAADGICRAATVEAKNRTGKLTKHQEEVIPRLRANNIPVLVTGDFTEACNFIRSTLNLPNEPKP